jgi:hypothetical protein
MRFPSFSGFPVSPGNPPLERLRRTSLHTVIIQHRHYSTPSAEIAGLVLNNGIQPMPLVELFITTKGVLFVKNSLPRGLGCPVQHAAENEATPRTARNARSIAKARQ